MPDQYIRPIPLIYLLRGETAHRAVLLLNRYSADFEIRQVRTTSSIHSFYAWLALILECPTQVLRLIPEHWSLEMLSRFLASSMRTSLHTYRECQIVRALARGDHFKVSLLRMSHPVWGMH